MNCGYSDLGKEKWYLGLTVKAKFMVLNWFLTMLILNLISIITKSTLVWIVTLFFVVISGLLIFGGEADEVLAGEHEH